MTEEEKLAEEYVRLNCDDSLNSFRGLEIKQAFLAGYNKANEWHYVKDGKYPTHSNRVLVFTDEGIGFGIFGLDNQKWYTYDTGFEVIAWKEIVLP